MILLPIFLPKNYKVKVVVGQDVKIGQVLAAKTNDARDEVIHLALDFGISPKSAIKTIKKTLGSNVKKGDIIAIKKKIGFRKKEIISEFNGTVIKISEDTGDLFVRVISDDDEILGEPIMSPVEGTVDFCDNEKIVLKTERNAIVADKACGKDSKGTLLILDKKEVEDLDVKTEVSGKIVAGRSFEKAAIFKTFAIGGLGIIASALRQEDLEECLAKELSKPLFLLSEENYKKLEELNGKQIYLDVKNRAIFNL